MDTHGARTQAERQAAARRLLRRAAGKLEIAADGRVRITDPELARAMLPYKGELRELLIGVRCRRCGEPLDHARRLPVEGGGHVHERCAGRPPVRG